MDDEHLVARFTGYIALGLPYMLTNMHSNLSGEEMEMGEVDKSGGRLSAFTFGSSTALRSYLLG